MQREDRQNFTRKYVQCIVNNQQLMEPTKSCQVTRNNRYENGPPFDSIYITNSPKKNKFLGIKPIQVSKVFHPAWKEESVEIPIAKVNKQQEKIDLLMQKNEQIAKSLIKDRKSMSDIVYKNNIQPHHALRNPSNYNIENKSNAEPIRDGYRMQLMFPIIKKQTNKKKSPPKEDMHIVMVMSDKEHKIKDWSVEKEDEELIQQVQSHKKEEVQPFYSDVTNVQIKKFLRLKQHAYKSDNALVVFEKEQADKEKKKKMYKHRQKLMKKQKQKLKNSLQEYLQAKIIKKDKKNLQKQIIISSTARNSQIQNTKKQVTAATQGVQQQKSDGNKTDEKSNLLYMKSKKNIGAKAKISKKNLFVSEPEATIYEGKMKMYRQFIFIMNMAHGVFNPVKLQDQPYRNQPKYKYYLGRGNNRQLIKTLMKRRFWWVQTDNPAQANFVWTQLKVNSVYDQQSLIERNQHFFMQGQDSVIADCKVSPSKKSYLFRAPLPKQPLKKVLLGNDIKGYRKFKTQIGVQNQIPDKYMNFQVRLKFFSKLKILDESKQLHVHNHLQQNFLIGNKKALFYNLKQYYDLMGKNVFQIIPLTYHIGDTGVSDPVYKEFLREFKQNQMKKKGNKNVWIVKPGENSNRGNGITVLDQLYEINKILNSAKKSKQEGPKTFIIQKYIQKPLLYKGRKFDIRHYMLATKMHGKMRLYWFAEGYVRTSSFDYNLQQIGDVEVHLTNDAIQQNCENYGKYEEGNKISYTELQRYFDVTYPNRKYSIVQEFYPRAKQIALDSFKSSYLYMDPRNLGHNFEIFGLDFMIDANFNIWLIEVNTNPCLQLSSGLLNRIIPNMVQNSLRLALDPLFPPTCHYPNSLKHIIPDSPLDRLRYELIFDQERDGRQIQALLKDKVLNKNLQNLQEDQDTYDDDGNQVQIDLE